MSKISGEPTEPTYSSDVKEWLNEIFKEIDIGLKKARVEETKAKKRADILIYDDKNECLMIIEVKRPKKEPDDRDVREQVFLYSDLFGVSGIKYVATHNVNRLVIWDTDTFTRVRQFQIANIDELREYYSIEEEIKEKLKSCFIWFGKLLRDQEVPRSIDEDIIDILHSQIIDVIKKTTLISHIKDNYFSNNEFRKKFDGWLVDQAYSHHGRDEEKFNKYCRILAKQFTYMFTNKILFYNILKQKFSLPDFLIQEGLVSEHFHAFINPYFENTIKITHDYETVFRTNFVDSIVIPNDSINELRKISNFLAGIDYTKIQFDVIGKIFEKLIPREERHKLGQFFTRSDIVDLILGFCVKKPEVNVLDPSCGTGTFLVRSYNRLRYLGNTKAHQDLLKQIWGVDIAKFPVHLATINLAIRDIQSEENYPLIAYNDFFDVFPNTIIKIGSHTTLDNWIGDKSVEISTLDESILTTNITDINVVIGNPPYTRQEELKGIVFGEKYKAKLQGVLLKDYDIKLNSRAGIYAHFITHGASFIEGKNGNRLGFVTLRSFLDVSFGIELKKFLLNNFKIIAVIQSLKEKWFPDAQMIPCILILEKEKRKKVRNKCHAKFIQIKCKMHEIVPLIIDEENKLEEIERWKKIDKFVHYIENFEQDIEQKNGKFVKFSKFIIEDNKKYRILSIKQKNLIAKNKWGTLLTAPLSYFKILEENELKNNLIKLEDIAKITSGLKTGANEYFYFPNKNFAIKEINDSYLILKGKKKYKKLEFKIEREYISPILVKFKPQRKIKINENDGYCLTVPYSKRELKREKKKVLKYILFGEKYPKEKPYSKRPTCRARITKDGRDWFNIDYKIAAPLLHFEIETNREIAFFYDNKQKDEILDKSFMSNYGFYNITPKNPANTEIILGVLNSTLGLMMIEFGGRYIENRDGTISNQTRVYELKNLLTLNPDKIDDEKKDRIRKLVNKIAGREILRIWEDVFQNDRKELDEIIFKEILGLSDQEIIELLNSLALIAESRNIRKN